MPLADFLTAFRQMILEDGPPAASVQDRRSSLAARFPKLTPTEIEDLLAMPPDRLAVYTDLVFAGQRGTLQWIFPATLAVIHRIEGFAEATREARDLDFALVRDFHRHGPWKDSSTRSLARGFEQYLATVRTDLAKRWPGLADLALLERVDLEVFYARDESVPRTRPEQVESLTSLQVEELMLLKVARPAYAATHDFAYDVLSIVDSLRRNGELPDALPGPQSLSAICGRSIHTLSAQWIRLDPAQSAAIAAITPGKSATVNDLAEAFLAGLPNPHDRTDQAAFEEFFGRFVGWLVAGAIVMCPAD